MRTNLSVFIVLVVYMMAKGFSHKHKKCNALHYNYFIDTDTYTHMWHCTVSLKLMVLRQCCNKSWLAICSEKNIRKKCENAVYRYSRAKFNPIVQQIVWCTRLYTDSYSVNVASPVQRFLATPYPLLYLRAKHTHWINSSWLNISNFLLIMTCFWLVLFSTSPLLSVSYCSLILFRLHSSCFGTWSRCGRFCCALFSHFSFFAIRIRVSHKNCKSWRLWLNSYSCTHVAVIGTVINTHWLKS